MGPGSQEASFSQEGPRKQKPLAKTSFLAIGLLEAMDLLECTALQLGAITSILLTL